MKNHMLGQTIGFDTINKIENEQNYSLCHLLSSSFPLYLSFRARLCSSCILLIYAYNIFSTKTQLIQLFCIPIPYNPTSLYQNILDILINATVNRRNEINFIGV